MKLHQVPVSARPCQYTAPIDGFPFTQPLDDLSPDQRPVNLNQHENGREDILGSREKPPDFLARSLAQQPREGSTRLGVQPHRLPRAASRSSVDVIVWSSRVRWG